MSDNAARDLLIDAFTRGVVGERGTVRVAGREFIARERSLVGFDPYRCELGDVQRQTVEKLMDYLQADGLLQRRFSPQELFPFAGK